MDNMYLRKALGMTPEQTGVLINRIQPTTATAQVEGGAIGVGRVDGVGGRRGWGEGRWAGGKGYVCVGGGSPTWGGRGGGMGQVEGTGEGQQPGMQPTRARAQVEGAGAGGAGGVGWVRGGAR